MSLFQPSNRQAFKAHAHVAGDLCPLCDQPIAQDIARKIEAKKREQYQAALDQARAEATAAAEQKVQAARAEAKLAAETAVTARLADIQSRLAQAEQAKAAAQAQMTTLKAAQEAAVEARVAEIQAGLQRQKEDLQREKDSAVLAEKGEGAEAAVGAGRHAAQARGQVGKRARRRLRDRLVRGAAQCLRGRPHPARPQGRQRRRRDPRGGAQRPVCGKIIYDAKNRDCLAERLLHQAEGRQAGQAADHAILSSNKFPKDKSQVHDQDGVIVANPARVLAIVEILRDQIVRMHELRISKEAREEKTVALYAFVTSDHFKQLVEQVEAQAGKMLDLDSKEQEAHRRIWERAQQAHPLGARSAQGDLTFEIDRIIGTAGNGPEEAA